ncbi:hypothetical protein GOP47_0028898 [Adiantum capillus-veneris]|nr:hypothetical protein GOP47_0028898 [Adiantum capillus-veneris]
MSKYLKDDNPARAVAKICWQFQRLSSSNGSEKPDMNKSVKGENPGRAVAQRLSSSKETGNGPE